MRLKDLFIVVITALLFILALLWTAGAFGIYHPVFAFAVTWIPNGFMVVIFPRWPINLTEGYYIVRPFEIRLYQKLGIRIFKRILQNRIYRAIVPEFHSLSKRNSLDMLDQTMRNAETAHVLTFIGVLLLTGYALLHQEFKFFLWIAGLNIMINGYPVMLQRYNRDRLQHLIIKSKKKLADGLKKRDVAANE